MLIHLELHMLIYCFVHLISCGCFRKQTDKEHPSLGFMLLYCSQNEASLHSLCVMIFKRYSRKNQCMKLIMCTMKHLRCICFLVLA